MSDASLHGFVANLQTPGFQARNYLAADALHEILNFLSEADRRGSAIHAAIYEMNDQQLIDALKPFGSRGHILIGNGSATKPNVAPQLTAAKLDVHHRDLWHAGRSSPSVHNKFVVECDASGKNPSRVLSGSTNWTTTGLCTQLNNVLVVEDAVIAARFLNQWNKLVAAGDDMPASLKISNSNPTADNKILVYYAASNNEAEFKPVLDLIAGAKEGALFLMFMPGQSPLLDALLARAQKNDIYVRGWSRASRRRKTVTSAPWAGKSSNPARRHNRSMTTCCFQAELLQRIIRHGRMSNLASNRYATPA